MRRIINSAFVSLDGVTEDPPSWAVVDPDAQLDTGRERGRSGSGERTVARLYLHRVLVPGAGRLLCRQPHVGSQPGERQRPEEDCRSDRCSAPDHPLAATATGETVVAVPGDAGKIVAENGVEDSGVVELNGVGKTLFEIGDGLAVSLLIGLDLLVLS